MNTSKIIGIETANPKLKGDQEKVLEHILEKKHISKKAMIFYKRFLSDQSIKTRYFGMDDFNLVNEETPDEAILRFQTVGTQIGAEAVNKCLEATGINTEDIDGLIVTTCTGYLCPGLTSYVAQAVGLRDSLFTLDLTGTGCGAALPALRAADQYLKAHANSNILVLSVEVCSAALSWGDEIDLILSNAIFGDGAAACLISNVDDREGYAVLDFESLLWPEYRNDLRFKQKNSRLCNVINKNVPEVASEAVKTLQDRFMSRMEGPFHYYAIHPGGRRILDEIESRLGFGPNVLNRSREVLRDYGNMSSPSVLYVLKNIIEKDQPKEEESIILFAFGAGFTAFGAVLQYAPVKATQEGKSYVEAV